VEVGKKGRDVNGKVCLGTFRDRDLNSTRLNGQFRAGSAKAALWPGALRTSIPSESAGQPACAFVSSPL
jgi:hypothetical protein